MSDINEINCLEVTSVQIYPIRERAGMGNIRALATVILADQLIIRSLRVMDGENGMFVGYPTDPSSEGFRSICFPITRALREHIEKVVLDKYLAETETPVHEYLVRLTHPCLHGAVLELHKEATCIEDASDLAITDGIALFPDSENTKDEWDVLLAKQQ